jgi:hypothetical protein
VFAGAGGALALLAAVVLPGAAQAAPAATAGVKLAGGPLGINIAPWDALYTGKSGAVIAGLMKQAGINNIRYGGGTTADNYNWKTNTDIGGCWPNTSAAEYGAKCSNKDALYFGLLSKQARATKAQSFVDVNYGSGTPALAAAWVKQSATKAGQQVALWEIGNENYGCWEANNPLAGAPEKYPGYSIGNNATCPMVAQGLAAGTTTMATSYAVNAAKYFAAMRAVNPKAQIGVPWAFGADVPGADVGDNTEWNNKLFAVNRKNINFVDAHWYPESFGGSTGGGNPTAQKVLKDLYEIPAIAKETRAQLTALGSSAKIVVGETGVSFLATTIPCTPTGALFAAGDALGWLSAGAETVDWWTLDNGANGNAGTSCSKADEGMFTVGAKPTGETYYVGYLLASQLAKPSAQLSVLSTSNPNNVLAYKSVLPNGKIAIALININTTSAAKVTYNSGLSGKLHVYGYKAASQNSLNTRTSIGTSTGAKVAKGLTLPKESITILTEN